MKKKELLEAISASEGRVLVCETIGILQPMLGDVTNAEFVASMGADMILLNMFDVNHPVIQGLPKTEDREVIRKIKQLTGRPVGINLEPLEQGKESSVETNEMWKLSGGRVATLEKCKNSSGNGRGFHCANRKSGNWGHKCGDYGYLEALQRAFGRTGGADCRKNACVRNFI